MVSNPDWRKQELDIVFELLAVLTEPLDMHKALSAAYPLVRKLIPTEHGALCVSRSDEPTLYDWTVAEMPEGFFRGYADIAEHDFVRAAVARRPNVVLCDADMVPSRTDLEHHVTYDYCRSHGVPIEHAMAVMLSTEPTWHGGLMLYRDKRVAFSEHERQILQFLTPYLCRTVANCKRFGDLARWSSLLETSISLYRTGVLVLSSTMRLLACSNGAEGLLGRCFKRDRRADDGLPESLHRQIRRLPQGLIPAAPPSPWIPSARGAGVVVTFVPVVKDFGTCWLVLLDEIPEDWREKLTLSEIDVAVRVAQGWDNQLVADELGNTVLTVKTHLYRIFNKLGIENRAVLMALFRQRK